MLGKTTRQCQRVIFALLIIELLLTSLLKSLSNSKEIIALNQIANWDFNGNATGWSSTNDNGTNICGDNNSSTGDTAFATLAYSSGTYQAVTSASKNTNFRSMVYASFTAPGSGSVNAKGKLSYYANGASWGSTNSSWVRLDIYNSDNSTFIGNLFCVSFNSNQDTTSSYGSDLSLTGGTTYTVRATMRTRVGSSNSAITMRVDDWKINIGIQIALAKGEILEEDVLEPETCDLNADKVCNVIDLSILLYYIDR